MASPFVEMLCFQVKIDRAEDFETIISRVKAEQACQPGCMGITYFKRYYTFDGVELGQPPRELARAVKCIKYYAWWTFDTAEHCGQANGWLFEHHYKEIVRLLLMPYDISSGYALP